MSLSFVGNKIYGSSHGLFRIFFHYGKLRLISRTLVV